MINNILTEYTVIMAVISCMEGMNDVVLINSIILIPVVHAASKVPAAIITMKLKSKLESLAKNQ